MLRSLLVILILTTCSFLTPPDNRTDKLVIKAAETQLDLFLSRIEPGREADYGFTNEDNLENCSLAKPYRMLTFNQDFYSGDIVEYTNYLDIQNEWKVPVTLKGEHRVLLTVNGNPGNFTVSGIGEPEMAKELEFKAAGMSENDQYYILHISALSADFFVSEHDNSFADARFVPLASARTNIPALGDNKKEYTLDDVQDVVKKAIKEKADKNDPQKKKPVKNKSTKKRTIKKHTK